MAELVAESQVSKNARPGAPVDGFGTGVQAVNSGVESLATHPFRTGRGKSGAPRALAQQGKAGARLPRALLCWRALE